MIYTQTQLDALRAAYASGMTEVSYDGRQVKYRSLGQLARAIATLERALGARPAASRITYPEVSRD